MSETKCHSPFWVKNPTPWDGHDEIPVPCGRCPPCKRRRVNDRTFLVSQEDKLCTSAHFVTLTYDTMTVPISKTGRMTLKPKDLTDFLKRLRYYDKSSNIRYFACGEYGSERWRPHYHCIIFNVEDILSFDKAWGLGSVDIGTVTGASIAYTAKYISKPQRVPQYPGDDRVREFSRASKKLGHNYITPETVAYHHADLSRNYVTLPGGEKLAMPKVLRNKIYDEQQRKKQRRIITVAVQEAENDKQIDFYTKYGNEADYDAFLQSEKRGAYIRYYKDQTKRQDL